MITVRQLTKRYRSTLALDEVSFTVVPGRVTGFLGPNGAGKTTTLRIVMGLQTPTGGRAEIDGRAYRSLGHPLREVGSLLDAAAVHPGRTAENHLRFLAASNDIARRRVVEVLDSTGLADVARRRVGAYSLGMRQRLGIAVALLGDPPVLVFDEPLNGLDPEGIHWFRNLMRTFATEGRTVFVSSHLISEIARTADHLIVLGRGRVLADCAVDALVHGPGSLEQAYLTLTGSAAEFRTSPRGTVAR